MQRPVENNVTVVNEQKFQTLRLRLAKAAFDTVRVLCRRGLSHETGTSISCRWGHPHSQPSESQKTRQGCDLRWAKLQSPIASVQRRRSTLAGHSAGPRGTNATPMNANRAIRIAAHERRVYEDPNSVFLGGDMTAN